MKVGFLNNQIDNRGTGNAVFDYAHYNEEILGNESRIFTFDYSSHDQLSVRRYLNRFSQIIPIDIYKRAPLGVDVLYHIKSGYDDGFRPPESVRYAIHAVFNRAPHGDRYATISSWLSGGVVPFVPHIVLLPDTQGSLRAELEIPDSGKVFGRHGGADSFDIEFIRNSMGDVLDRDENIWFVFLNTDFKFDHPRVKFLGATANPIDKRRFINTCDAMLHGRARGETFGIAVGEFASCGKPIITYCDSPEQAHIEELGEKGHYYYNEEQLTQELLSFEKHEDFAYTEFTPEKVMTKFKEVFLD